MHASEPAAGAVDHLATLVAHLAAFEVGGIDDHRTHVVISASLPGQATANCLACGMSSSRVHGRYRRLLQDLPAGGRAVLIALTIRRLRCGTPACQVRTFAEPAGDLAARHARTPAAHAGTDGLGPGRTSRITSAGPAGRPRLPRHPDPADPCPARTGGRPGHRAGHR